MPEERTTPTVPSQASSPEAQLRDKRTLPEGVVPKQAQAYVVAGLALLILLAVLFSKNHARTLPRNAVATSTSVYNDMNQRKIQELEEDLSADQRQSQQQTQAQKESAAGPVSSSASPTQMGCCRSSTSAGTRSDCRRGKGAGVQVPFRLESCPARQ